MRSSLVIFVALDAPRLLLPPLSAAPSSALFLAVTMLFFTYCFDVIFLLLEALLTI
jgi:hypothetical protein